MSIKPFYHHVDNGGAMFDFNFGTGELELETSYFGYGKAAISIPHMSKEALEQLAEYCMTISRCYAAYQFSYDTEATPTQQNDVFLHCYIADYGSSSNAALVSTTITRESAFEFMSTHRPDDNFKNLAFPVYTKM